MDPAEDPPEFDPALAKSEDWQEPSSSSEEGLPLEPPAAAAPAPLPPQALPELPAAPADLPSEEEPGEAEGREIRPSPTISFQRMELPDHELRAAETLLDLSAVSAADLAAAAGDEDEDEDDDEDADEAVRPVVEFPEDEEDDGEDDAVFLAPGEELPPGVGPAPLTHDTERLSAEEISQAVPEALAQSGAHGHAQSVAAEVAAELGFGGPEDASDDQPMLLVAPAAPAPPFSPGGLPSADAGELQEAYECLQIRTPIQEFEAYARARCETLVRLGDKERAELAAAALRLGQNALRGVMGAVPKESGE